MNAMRTGKNVNADVCTARNASPESLRQKCTGATVDSDAVCTVLVCAARLRTVTKVPVIRSEKYATPCLDGTGLKSALQR